MPLDFNSGRDGPSAFAGKATHRKPSRSTTKNDEKGLHNDACMADENEPDPSSLNSSKECPQCLAKEAVTLVPSSAATQGNGGGHTPSAALAKYPAPSAVALEETIATIRYWHRQRVFAMATRKRMDLALGSFLRLQLGWSKDAPPEVQEAAKDGAKALIANAEKEAAGKPFKEAIEGYNEWRLILLAAVGSRKPFDDVETRATKEMERLAKSLPVWKWAEPIRGLGARSIATIIAETGDLSQYPKKGHLWKRMGLAVIGRGDGENDIRQGGLSKTAKAEHWIAHGYSAKRRAVMFVIGDVLVKQGEYYREVYLARKEYERQQAAERGLIVAPSAKIPKAKAAQYISDGQIHKRAQRYMEKKVLRDLWNAWKADRDGLAGDAQ